MTGNKLFRNENDDNGESGIEGVIETLYAVGDSPGQPERFWARKLA
jgi:hypothetical protein